MTQNIDCQGRFSMIMIDNRTVRAANAAGRSHQSRGDSMSKAQSSLALRQDRAGDATTAERGGSPPAARPTPGGGRADDPNFMTSIARGLSVIRAFTAQKPNLTIAEVAKISGLPRAAARRCLYTLD